MKRYQLLFILLSTVFLILSCKNGSIPDENTVSVTGIELNPDCLTLAVGDSFRLIANVSPIDATEKTVVWESSHEEICTVNEEGFVTSSSIGTSIITATTVDGDYKAQCEINIRGPYPTNNVSADKEFMGVTLSWDGVQGATSYSVLWGTSPDEYPNRIDDVASPLFLPWVPFEQTHYFTVVANSSEGESINADAISVVRTLRRHSPEWASHIPTNTVSVSDILEFQIALSNASAGDWIKLEGGIYNLNTFFQINASGTVNSPIWITPDPGASVELTRPDANQITVNIGTTDHSEYLIFHGLEFSARSDALKLSDCSNIWIDNCTIHDCSNSGISANSENTSYLYITDNEIYNAGGAGCGIYLGGNNEAAITHHSIVADNYIHDITGTQGEGIELKYGSYANRITDNRIHTCNYSCIAVFGTNEKEFNIIQRNILYDSNESVLFVTGESMVRNNLVIAGGQYSFYSTDSGSASVKELSVLHNTFINSGDAVRLRNWSGRSGLVFANNACYSQNAEAINTDGTIGVLISGNVVFGSVSNFPTTGYIVTPNGIADFVDVAWDGSARNAAPCAGSTLLGAADTAYAVDSDLYGKTRTCEVDVEVEGGVTVLFSITGTGAGTPDIEVRDIADNVFQSEQELYMGYYSQFESAPTYSFPVKNAGNATLIIESIDNDPADSIGYTLNNNILEPDQETTLDITAHTDVTGNPVYVSLTLNTNDPNDQAFVIYFWWNVN